MNVRERQMIYFYEMTPDVPFCVNCKHYRQHYLKNGIRLTCGHCCQPRLKFREDYDTCSLFEKREENSKI